MSIGQNLNAISAGLGAIELRIRNGFERENILMGALEQIIQFNRDHANEQYGDANKCETWACVRVAREAMANALKVRP